MAKKITINFTSKFEKSLYRLNRTVAQEFAQKQELFIQNPFSPSLKTHKLSGRLRGYWSFSVNYSFRVLFIFETEYQVTLVNVGTHGIYK